jgi:hypothetical protein
VTQPDADDTVNLIKETFRVILNYLRQFYEKEYQQMNDPKTMEGIKTIMVLVGEAAKKLDKYTTLFQATKGKSVTDLKEYKQLQDFYFKKIARKIDEGTLGRWILGLTLRAKGKKKLEAGMPGIKGTETKHVFVDLESVKKDNEYELFFLRKEDGSRFFNPRLIRNIKLVCDFGDYFREIKESDPLLQIKFWQDRVFHVACKDILKALGSRLNDFYRHALALKENELVASLNKALMALMLGANAHNLLQNRPAKSCGSYFKDFQLFLREVLHNRDFQKLVAYPPQDSTRFSLELVELTYEICQAFFLQVRGYQEIVFVLQELILEANLTRSKEHEDAAETSHLLWNRLACDYAALSKLLKRHPNGPLLKVLEILEEGSYHAFDPIMQANIPNELYDFYFQERKIENVRMPTPTFQEFINKVSILEEFKAYLRSLTTESMKGKHLIINLQDRTSWREHFRSVALEELQKQEELADAISVVTLAVDTDFYHQLAPYHDNNHAETFIEQFKEHLESESSGYYFPLEVKNQLFSGFTDGVIAAIHRIFFSNKNVLLREHRLDFMEIFYLFLCLKVIELTQPDYVSLICKDGIDVSSAYNAELFGFLKLINRGEITAADQETLNMILYAPSTLIRERVLMSERFNRMISALKTIEFMRQELGPQNFALLIHDAFGLYYKTPILESMLLIPKSFSSND